MQSLVRISRSSSSFRNFVQRPAFISAAVQRMPLSMSSDAALDIFKKTDAVCFDVDSTVCTEEGIDVLAAHCGAGQAVAEWTSKAMGGDVKFEVALEARLQLISPSRNAIDECLAVHPPVLTPGVADLVAALKEDGKDVYLVSGGFRLMIEPVAARLNIPIENIFANTIFFNENGEYSSFDANEPTSKDGGKPQVVQMLKDKFGYTTVAMVGDGATDMQAKPPADVFVGFGGIVEREVVKNGADIFVHDFTELTDRIKKP